MEPAVIPLSDVPLDGAEQRKDAVAVPVNASSVYLGAPIAQPTLRMETKSSLEANPVGGHSVAASTPSPLSFNVDSGAHGSLSALGGWKTWGLQKFRLLKQAVMEQVGSSLPTVDRVCAPHNTPMRPQHT